MSYRPSLGPTKVFTDLNLANTQTSYSAVSVIEKISLVCYTYSWTGSSPVGVLRVQVSNDYSLSPTGAVLNADSATWSDVSFVSGGSTVTSIAVGGNAGSANIVLPLLGAYAIRTIYTRTSGTGTMQAYICGKVA